MLVIFLRLSVSKALTPPMSLEVPALRDARADAGGLDLSASTRAAGRRG
eukprot:CAMPEP_0183584540 /NCGR_PEP_ID=MMETSP0371-20130417/153654_1 /TAXON_ID=268820 /ORGANISM="Peridinium aciculiferum, Strain PAER-2" /LENGTH=48 /DNA_ID= /DNA_START= /DNA_END= /DNA_ORIENTATION=